MVETEELFEPIGVFLVRLELVDELDLAIEQALVATCEVDDKVAETLTHQALLLRRNEGSRVLHCVEGDDQLAQLVVLLLDLDRGELRRFHTRRPK